MNSPRNTDRDAILARRALFVSTALAGIACTGTQTTTEGKASEQVTSAAASEAGEHDGPEQPRGPAPNTPWAEVMAQAPPLDIPEGLPEREQQHLRTFERVQASSYDNIRALWEQVPACGAELEDCEVWTALAKDLEPYFDDGLAGIGGCYSAVGETGTVVARRAAHARFQDALLEQLQTYLEGVANHYGPPSASAWQTKLASAKAPKPMPCLSPCAMPTFSDVLTLIPFAKDSPTLALDKPELRVQMLLDQVSHQASTTNAGAKLVVRGHADPSEADAVGLAKQRAEAVAAWLIEAGIAKDQIEVVGLGSRLLIERGEAGLEHNPRVDFELVPPDLVEPL